MLTLIVTWVKFRLKLLSATFFITVNSITTIYLWIIYL